MVINILMFLVYLVYWDYDDSLSVVFCLGFTEKEAFIFSKFQSGQVHHNPGIIYCNSMSECGLNKALSLTVTLLDKSFGTMLEVQCL